MRRELHSVDPHSILTRLTARRSTAYLERVRAKRPFRVSQNPQVTGGEVISRSIKILRKEEECLECLEETRNYSRYMPQLTLRGNFLDYTTRESG